MSTGIAVASPPFSPELMGEPRVEGVGMAEELPRDDTGVDLYSLFGPDFVAEMSAVADAVVVGEAEKTTEIYQNLDAELDALTNQPRDVIPECKTGAIALTLAGSESPATGDGASQSAEALRQQRLLEKLKEAYAYSLTGHRAVGRLALTTEISYSPELEVAIAALWEDFLTNIAEMLNTDPDFRDRLDMEHRYTLPVVDGQARSPFTGEPMVDVLADGRDVALKAAESDPRMLTQAKRDEHDRVFAVHGDMLSPGKTRIGCSMFPRDAMERDGRKYWEEGKNYRWGQVFIQFQSNMGDGTRPSGAFSIDAYNEDVLRTTLAEFGMPIPETADSDEWLSHAIELELSADAAADLVRKMKHRYYELAGQAGERLSVTEYIEANSDVPQKFFESFILPLTTTLETKKLSPVHKQFIEDTLGSADKLSDTVKDQIRFACITGEVDDVAARAIDSLIVYATVEQLRKGLPAVISRLSEPKGYEPVNYHVASMAVSHDPMALSRLAAGNIGSGVSAGRTYGGCAQGGPLLGEGEGAGLGSDGTVNTPVEGANDSEDAGDGLGPLWFECPRGHRNKRTFGRLLDVCGKCGTDVSCGGAQKTKAASAKQTWLSNPANRRWAGRLDKKESVPHAGMFDWWR